MRLPRVLRLLHFKFIILHFTFIQIRKETYLTMY